MTQGKSPQGDSKDQPSPMQMMELSVSIPWEAK